jgi:hypothetical protein
MTISKSHHPSLAIPIPVYPELWVIPLEPVDRPHLSPLSKASLESSPAPMEGKGVPQDLRRCVTLPPLQVGFGRKVASDDGGGKGR